MRRRPYISTAQGLSFRLVRPGCCAHVAGRAYWPLVVALVLLSLPAPLPAAHARRPATLPPPGGITLTATPASPQPVGTPITWTAVASDTVPLVYRFSVATAATGPFTVVRDYSSHNFFVWAPLQEGTYYIQVTVQEGYTGTATASTAVSDTITSRVSGTSAAVSATANPLVALYSAPACRGGRIAVAFRAQGTTPWQYTNIQSCRPWLSRNFLVAGLLPATTYQMAHVVISGTSSVTSTPLLFTTGNPPPGLQFPIFTVSQPPAPQSDTAEPLLFHALMGVSSGSALANPVATDLQGHVVWYAFQADLTAVWPVRIQQLGGPLGSIVYIVGSDALQQPGDDVLRSLDLAGDPLQETNVQAVNAQLAARGDDTITGFHHDAMRLPNGDTAVLGSTQRTITTTTIQGDMLIVLDRNMQVVWAWDAFTFLTPPSGPALHRRCAPGCAAHNISVIDWTHANAIDWSPGDGNIILSLRNLNWVIKINYSNGNGDGSIVWTLGQGGDFTLVPLNPADPYPWFSGQHDANYIDGTTLELFDDGGPRCATQPPPCYNRGQVYVLDEQSRVVTQTVNVDLGVYSPVLGTAQRLSTGTYNFTSGEQSSPPPLYAQDIEVQPDGTRVYVQQINTLEYRAWRLATMYSSINPPCPVCLHTH